jgi:hypothetical protein
MLVAVGIIVTLATMTVLLMPRVNEQQRAARGAQLLQGWLTIARQWAIRDQSPRGLQWTTSGTFSDQLYYVQQPENFVPMSLNTTTNILSANPLVAYSPPGDPTQPGLKFPSPLFPSGPTGVQQYDYLLIPGEPAHRIKLNNGNVLALDSAISIPSGQPSRELPQYWIVRQPQPVANEPQLQSQLPRDIAIDNLYSQMPPPLTMGTTSLYTIMFGPSGAVTGSGAAYDKIIVYVRDSTLSSYTDGAPTLITIYTRTGFIAAHPVNTDTSLGDVYYFTTLNQASGM